MGGFKKEFKNSKGECIEIPENWLLRLDEVSNGIFELNLTDEFERTVSDKGWNLDEMVERAVRIIYKWQEESNQRKID